MYIVLCIIALLAILSLKDKVADWGAQQTRRDAKAGRVARNFMILLVGGGLLAATFTNKDSSSSESLPSYRTSTTSSYDDVSVTQPDEADSTPSPGSVNSTGSFDDVPREPSPTPSATPSRVNVTFPPMPTLRRQTPVAGPSPSATPFIQVRRALPVDSSRASGLR